MWKSARWCPVALVAGTLTLAFLIGCSPQTSSTSVPSTVAASEASSVSGGTPLPVTASPASGGLEISVHIQGRSVTPSNARFDAKAGAVITLRVDSDVDEELHVHSDPDHEFEVEPKTGQVFTFSVAVPGQVAIELHHSGKTVATVTVR